MQPAIDVILGVVEHLSELGVQFLVVGSELKLVVWDDRGHHQSLRLLAQDVLLQLLVVGQQIFHDVFLRLVRVVVAEVVGANLDDEKGRFALVRLREQVEHFLELGVHTLSRLSRSEQLVIVLALSVRDQQLVKLLRDVMMVHQMRVSEPHVANGCHLKITKGVDFSDPHFSHKSFVTFFN